MWIYYATHMTHTHGRKHPRSQWLSSFLQHSIDIQQFSAHSSPGTHRQTRYCLVSQNLLILKLYDFNFLMISVDVGDFHSISNHKGLWFKDIKCFRINLYLLFFCISTIVWMLVFPPNSHVGILMLNEMLLGGGGLWKVVSSWGWRPHEWSWCPHERDPRELPSPFHLVKT